MGGWGGGFGEGLGSLFRLFLRQPHHAEPHPGGWVLRIGSGLLLNRDKSFIYLIESEQRHAEKQVCAAELRFQDQCSLKTGNGFLEPVLFLEHEAKVQMRLRKTRIFLDDCGESFACFAQLSFPHSHGRLSESLVDVRPTLRRCKSCCPRK